MAVTNIEFVVYIVAVGIGATVLTDLWSQFLRRALGVQSLSWCMVGRWVGHMRLGTFRHENIARASHVSGECALGWVFHYAAGIALAAALLLLVGKEWAGRPSLLPALGFGIVTVVLPFFVLQPGMGAGVLASRTPNPRKARLRSLATHLIFGLGLYLSATVLRAVVE